MGRKYDLSNGSKKAYSNEAYTADDTTVQIKANGKLEGQEKPSEAEPPIETISFFSLFRFADGTDKILMTFGTLCAIMQGVTLQINFLILAQILDSFIRYGKELEQNTTISLGITEDPRDYKAEIEDLIPTIVWQFSANATAVMVTGFVHMTCWNMTAERQIRVIRQTAFKAVLKQHMAWFDKQQSGELNIRLSSDMITLYNGIGDKVATCIQWVSTFFAGAALCFYTGWELTLVVLCVAPALAIIGGIAGRLLQSFATKEVAAYGQAGAVAEEVLSSIRIVTAYNGQSKEAGRYEAQLAIAKKVGVHRGYMTGTVQGTFWFLIFSVVALAFWYGNILVDKSGYEGGAVIQVLFSLFAGMRSLGFAISNFESFALAKSAGAAIFKIIDLNSEIDSTSPSGVKPPDCKGNISIKNVSFKYPTRDDYMVLTDFTLDILRGQTVAIVGPSGSGKSTIVQLIQRLYDVTEGSVMLDGRDVRSLNVSWLRHQIGVVSQEPVLFATTIEKNIMFGLDGATHDDVVWAAKKANAHDFIMKLPDQYKTMVGARGAQLSGGQKQRIAIARALIKDPKILLLDDATSALDYQSEAMVQEALDNAREGRTTVIVAHRLSSVRNADVICCIDQGRIIESGTHKELLAHGGLYAKLASKQITEDQQPSKPAMLRLNSTDSNLSQIDEDSDLVGSWSSVSPLDGFILGGAEPLRRSLSRRMSHTSQGRGSIRSRKRMTSATYSEMIEPEDEEDAIEVPSNTVRRVFKLNTSEWPYLLIGSIGSIVQGAIWPLLTFFTADILAAFALDDKDERTSQINQFVLIQFGIGIVAFFSAFSMISMFSVSGEKLTERLRSMSFRSMLRQEVGWFDEQRNQVGALTSQLATDASTVKAATGAALSTVVNALSSMILSLTVAFIFGWQLSLVAVLFVPFLFGTGMAQTKLMVGYASQNKGVVEEGGKMVSEVVDNIKTVAALTKEQHFIHNFSKHFEGSFNEGRKRSFVFGITWGLSNAILFFAYAANYGVGAYFITQDIMRFEDVFRVFACISVSAVELGRVNAFVSDYSKAKVSAAKLLALFDRQPAIDPNSTEGVLLLDRPDQKTNIGNVHFRNVFFRYPTRPEATILQGLDVEVKSGETLALVGPSGCGKSTTIQLMERFYDPESGSVHVDGRDVRDYQVSSLRQHISLVAQEPSLFDATVRENIAYGDLSREVPLAEIIEAAKMANIHEFISRLPEGYETNVGAKGIQLVGGQKQRIAIARALVGNPKILLLDEATSALDSENEKVVQEALDRAREGRTCIVIAHRLSTIEDADVIAVIDSGKVSEIGKHRELMKNGGLYYQLQQIQMGASH